MKHIKLFEGFDTDKYYQEISGNDFTTNNRNIVKMSDKNRSKIESWFKSDPNNTIYGGEKNITINLNKGMIYIYELEDDWFDVTFIVPSYMLSQSLSSRLTTVFYKCDQLEGLEKLLKDKGLI